MITARFRKKLKSIKCSEDKNSKIKIDILPSTGKEIEYAEQHKKRMLAYTVGSCDQSGNIIAKIFARGDNYLVYEIEGATEYDSFKVLVDTLIDSDPNGYIIRFEKIKPSINNFRSILHKGVHDKSIKHRAASAVSTALRGDIEAAEKMFSSISEEVEKEYRTISNGRFNYLFSAFAALLMLIFISGCFYVMRKEDFVINNALLKYFFYAACFSSLGGFLSICINLRDLEFERSMAWWKFEIYGLQRIILASACGVVAYLLIASGIFFSFLVGAKNSSLTIMVICVLAGFSEKLIPNALGRLEVKED